MARFYSTGTAFSPAPFLAGREPLALWRMLATQLQAILRINARLKGRTHDPSPKLSPDQWKIIDPDGDGPLDQPEDEQFFFQILINKWLTMGKVRPVLETMGWSPKSTKWTITIAYDGLVGALAYRLLLTLVGEDRLYICSGCGEPYIRTARAPRPGQENFCSDCGDIAARRAVERYRHKKKEREKENEA